MFVQWKGLKVTGLHPYKNALAIRDKVLLMPLRRCFTRQLFRHPQPVLQEERSRLDIVDDISC